jgi:cytochrome P450
MSAPRLAIPEDESGGSQFAALQSAAVRDLPVTHGSLLEFPADPIACLRKLQARHGDLAAMEEDGTRLYFVFTPEFNHQVLSDPQTFQSRFFAIRGPRNSPQRRLTSGLLSMNGEQHKRNRRLVMDAFQKRALWGYLPTIRLQCEQMLAEWRTGTERDIARDMTEFMLRVTGSILFGMDDPELAYRIGRMIDHWVHLNHEVGIGAFVSRPEIVARYDELLAFAGRLEAEIADLLQARRRAAGGRTATDMLSLLLQAHDEHGRLSDEELIGQTALMFGAAHLTTAHSLTWTLFLLAQHPRAMAALHHEWRRELSGGFPSIEDTERLPLTERAIKESMRILPASAYSQRMTSRPVQMGAFELPCAATVIFSQFMTHHRPDLYADPEAFLPERWERLAPSPYAYLPFGAGPRMCLGGPLALMILKTVLPAVLQRFKLTNVPFSEVSGKVISTMLSPTCPVLMRVEPQDGQFAAEPVVGNIHTLVELREAERRYRRAA